MRTTCFLAGLACLWAAVASTLAAHDESSVTDHLVQHLLLMMAAPPLVALGRPLVLAAQALPRPVQARLSRMLGRRAVTALGSLPVGWALYFGSMALMLADRTVYDYLVDHPLVHDGGHVWLLAAGLLYWEPLLGPAGRHRPSHPVRVLSVLAAMPFEVLVGLWFRYQGRPVDPINTLADTQRAGEAFIVGATLLSTVWLAVIVARWASAALREERRASLKAPSGEWTTPWWVGPPDVSGAAGGP